MSVAPPRPQPHKKAKLPAASVTGADPAVSDVCLKVNIRLLSPALKEDDLWEQLSQYTTIEPIARYYQPGHYSHIPYERPTYSRAYLLFRDRQSLDDFTLQISGKPFTERETGDSLVPVVANALYFNHMPSKASDTPLPLKSTLKHDARFKEFVKFLEGSVPQYSLDRIEADIAKEKKKKLRLKREKDRKNAEAPSLEAADKTDTKPRKPMKKLHDKKKKQHKKAPEKSTEAAVEAIADGPPTAKPKPKYKKLKKKTAKGAAKAKPDVQQLAATGDPLQLAQ